MTYALAVQTIDSMLNYGECTLVVEKRNGKLYYVKDGLTIIFKRG